MGSNESENNSNRCCFDHGEKCFMVVESGYLICIICDKVGLQPLNGAISLLFDVIQPYAVDDIIGRLLVN